MEAIKGIARRATQTVRENLSSQHLNEEEKLLVEATAKVHQFEKVGLSITEKLNRMSKLYGELGSLLKSVAEEFQTVPDKAPETEAMCNGLMQSGVQLIAKGAEFQNTLKEHSLNTIAMFVKEIPKLKEVEEDRMKKKLEYEFFKAKVLDLRKDPPKDTSRIPRNEQILENWRVELWKATETNKAAVSALYSQGAQVLDRSVLVMIQTTGNFVHSSASCLKQHLFNARLPVYPQTPLLVPAPLPPNPLPPFRQAPSVVSGPTQSQWQAAGGWATQPQQQQTLHHNQIAPSYQQNSSHQYAQNVPPSTYPPIVQNAYPQATPQSALTPGGTAPQNLL